MPDGTNDEALKVEAVPLPSTEQQLDVEEIIAEAVLLVRDTQICVRGDLRRRYYELEAELKEKADRGNRDGASLGEGSGLHALALELEEVRQAIAGSMRTFVFTSIGPQWSVLVAEHSDSQGNLAEAFFAEAVAKSSVSPKMTPEQAQRLFDRIGQGDIDRLFVTARRANTESTVAVPKSPLASRILEQRGSEPS